MSDIAARVVEATGEAFTRRAGAGLLPLVEALTASLRAADELLADTGRGWPALADLDNTPDPAWLGAITGTTIPYGVTTEEARELVRDRSSWRRGTPTAMLAAARAVFPVGLITLIERDGSAWKTTIRLYAAEATADDEAAVKAAVARHKPVGVVLDVVRVAGASYAHMSEEHGPTYAAHRFAFPTYRDAIAHIPEEGTTP